jgi:hypothetical protein
MTETALGLVKAESFQVPTLIADIGPEATKRYVDFLPFPSSTRIRGSLTIMPSASFGIGAIAPPLLGGPTSERRIESAERKECQTLVTSKQSQI